MSPSNNLYHYQVFPLYLGPKILVSTSLKLSPACPNSLSSL
jgi:hypothetical protein